MTSTAKRGNFGIKLLIWIVLLPIIFWLLLWVAAWQLSTRYLDTFIAREQAAGRTWTCGSRSAGGFPLNFSVTCTGVTLRANLRTGPLSVNLREITAAYSPFNPLSANIQLQGPLAATPPGGGKIDAKWESLAFTFAGDFSAPPSAKLAGRSVNLDIAAQGVEPFSILLGQLKTDLSPIKTTDGNENLNIRMLAENITSAALNQLLGNSEATHLDTVLNLQKFDALRRGGLPASLDGWRAARGVLEIPDFKITKGPLAFEAKGAMSLDPMRRPEGNLNTRMAGLSHLLERIGIPGVGGARGGLLGGLFRKPGTPQQADEASGRFIPLPLTFREGYIWVGPLRTPVALRPVL